MNSTLDDFGIRSENVRKKARITDDGAVLLGKNFVCDAHADRPVRVLTHVHSDHIMGLRESLEVCEKVIMTSATKRLLELLYEGKFENLGEVITLDYGETFQYEGETVTLYKAQHILGAAQVLVETEKGEKLLFTGDFKKPETPSPETDLLVLEATYGEPYQVRPFKDEIEEIFARFVEQRLENESVNILGYHGKLQEALQILREYGINNPAFMPSRIYEVAKLYEKEGKNLGKFHPLKKLDTEKIKEEKNIIRLFHMNTGKDFEVGSVVVKLSGWEFIEPIKQLGGTFKVALSDHSDFHQLINHVKECDPKFVITDNYRSDGAQRLAREITKRTQKPAVGMP